MNINICYAIHDKNNYCRYLATSITSVIKNTEKIIFFHIIHDNTLTIDSIDKLKLFIEKNNHKVIFYKIEDYISDRLLKTVESIADLINKRLTMGSLFRCFMRYILPIDVNKCIYLDCDTIVNIDIADLWSESTGSAGIAAVPECTATQGFMAEQPLCEMGKVTKENYFNTGVLLLDLNILRNSKEIIYDGLNFLALNKNCISLDQEIINLYYSSIYNKLDYKYNKFVNVLRSGATTFDKNSKCIYHYAGNIALLFPHDDYFTKLWLHYLSLSPWFDENYITYLSESVSNLTDASRIIFQKVLCQWGKKDFVLCGDANLKQTLRKLYKFAANAPFIEINDMENNPKLLEDSIKKLGKNSLIIVASKFYLLVQKELEKMGLVENEDFFYGGILLPIKLGGARSMNVKL